MLLFAAELPSDGTPLHTVATVSPSALAEAPQILRFGLPGVGTIEAIQRNDISLEQSTDAFTGADEAVQVADASGARWVQWIGEVDGFPGAQSVAIFNTDSIGSTFGFIRWVDLAQGTVNRYVVRQCSPGLSCLLA